MVASFNTAINAYNAAVKSFGTGPESSSAATAIERAMKNEPGGSEVIAKKDKAKHPFA